MQSLTRAQVREVDRLAIEELGIPGVVLMENAGLNAADIIIDLLDEIEEEHYFKSGEPRIAVICGGGNNGGDGYVIARHLYNNGFEVAIFAVRHPEELTGDAATMARIAQRMGLGPEFIVNEEQLRQREPELVEADVIVDAMLGTGFTGQVQGHLPSVIKLCNRLRNEGATIVSIDLPSGLDCDTGKPTNATIEADVTVTFVAMKRGFMSPESEQYTGRIVETDIGAPPELIERVMKAPPAR